MRVRVLLFSEKLVNSLSGEAMHHANWLRNRFPSERISGNIPIFAWNPNIRVTFGQLPTFGQNGLAFIYQSSTAGNKKLRPRAVHGRVSGMESDMVLFRIYVEKHKKLTKTRNWDFKPCSASQLPGISTLLDCLSRQSNFEAYDSNVAIVE